MYSRLLPSNEINIGIFPPGLILTSLIVFHPLTNNEFKVAKLKFLGGKSVVCSVIHLFTVKVYN